MAYKDYEKVLATLTTQLSQVKHVGIINPVSIKNKRFEYNKLLLVNRGKVTVEFLNNEIIACEGDIVFIPELYPVNITYGKERPALRKSREDICFREGCLTLIEDPNEFYSDSFSTIDFNAKVYGVIDMFKFIQIPGFKVSGDSGWIYTLFNKVFQEVKEDKTSMLDVSESLNKCLVVELMRYIERTRYLEELIIRISTLTDLRVANLFSYISENLGGDLTNETLADQVGLSRDYIGQFFKKAAGLNLQTYVEHTRLNKGAEFLKMTDMSVDKISNVVGFKQPAYFCKRFKSFHGKKPGEMRASFRNSEKKRNSILGAK